MVLVSLLLVLAAAVALVIGLLQSGLAIIYVSIGCSVVAGILLAVAVVRGRPSKPIMGGMPQAAPAPPPASASTAAPSSPAPSPSWQRPEESEREPALAGATLGRGRLPGSAPDATEQLDRADIDEALHEGSDDLPIPDYDTLRATEVLPLLASLDAAQLAEVRRHEAEGRNRFMVLSRIDRELETRGEETSDDEAGGWDAGDGWDEAEGGGAIAVGPGPSGRERGGAAGSDDDETDDDETEVEEAQARARTPARRASAGSMLDNYEQLKVLEILPRLSELDADELAQVRRREQAGQRRAMILNRIDRLIVEAPAARKAPARRAAAKTASARKAAPAKKAAAAKAPARRAAAATKAPAKKAPAKKATAQRATARKAPARKATKRG